MTDRTTANPQNLASKARLRFAILALLRLSGAMLIMAGLIIANRPHLGLPRAGGYALLTVGLGMFAFLPIILARRWKSDSGNSAQDKS